MRVCCKKTVKPRVSSSPIRIRFMAEICLNLIVTGSRDDIAPAEMIRQTYQSWNAAAHFEVIDGADHFYGGYENKLEEVLLSHIEP